MKIKYSSLQCLSEQEGLFIQGIYQQNWGNIRHLPHEKQSDYFEQTRIYPKHIYK